MRLSLVTGAAIEQEQENAWILLHSAVPIEMPPMYRQRGANQTSSAGSNNQRAIVSRAPLSVRAARLQLEGRLKAEQAQRRIEPFLRHLTNEKLGRSQQLAGVADSSTQRDH